LGVRTVIEDGILSKINRSAASGILTYPSYQYSDFFVPEKVKNQEITIKYCPTKEMIADFFTKPLQGTTFHNVRDVLMNFDPVINSMQDYRGVLKEPEPEWKMDHTRGKSIVVAKRVALLRLMVQL
jgi:hypothetical protein